MAVLRFIKFLTPSFIFKTYHFTLAFLAHVFYGMPSRKMYVIGVTGTKGKTTTCHLITQFLEALGKNVGMTSSIQFRLGGRVKVEMMVNDIKQGMPGRFRLQKLLKKMVQNGCEYAVVETTSEGMLQYRHRFIDYNMAVFTNLSPEHIERHGGFEKYRKTKVKLFEKIALRRFGKLTAGKAQGKRDGVGVYNLDDENVEYFLRPSVPRKIGFTLGKFQISNDKCQINDKIKISNVKLFTEWSEFDVNGTHFQVPLVGEFNVYNAAGAIAAVQALGVSLEKCAEILREVKPVAGRFEIIKAAPRPFDKAQGKQARGNNDGKTIIIDYAHEPRSLEECYRAAQLFLGKPFDTAQGQKAKLICLLGAQGGGRDKWKRAEMGKIAAKYCEEIILTNEDPYDEKPISIIEDIEIGITNHQETTNYQSSRIYKILDRKEAIKKAISLARPGDVVVLTGKGGEVWMCVEGGKKIPWDEREVVEESLREF